MMSSKEQKNSDFDTNLNQKWLYLIKLAETLKSVKIGKNGLIQNNS